MPTPDLQLLSRTVYTTDGATANWDFSFADGYLDQSHVKARTEDATGLRTEITVTPAMLIGEFQLRIFPALAAGLTLTIYRDTPKNAPLVNFSDESGFSEIALDTNARQAVMVAAETADEVNTSDVSLAVEAANAAAASAASAAADAASIAGSVAAAQAAEVAAEAAQAVAEAAAATVNPANFATAAQGLLADSALQPGAPSSEIAYTPAGTGAVATTAQAKLRESVSLASRITDTNDITSALVSFATDYPSGGVEIQLPVGNYQIVVGDVAMPGNITFIGRGAGLSTLTLHATSNPVSAKYMMTFLAKSNIKFKDMTLACDAAANNIFKLGSLVAGEFTPDSTGNLYALRVSQCSTVIFDNVEVKGFTGAGGAVLFTNEDGVPVYNKNVQILTCHSHDNRETGFSLQAVDGGWVMGGTHANNGYEEFDSVDAAGNPTSIVRTAANFIDGGTGYGIVLGRTTTANKLKSKNITCYGVTTSRNKRHGIDGHAAVDVHIVNCISEDDLLSAWNVQDTIASLDNTVGDITMDGGHISHTVYAEKRGALFDDSTSGTERPDSNPIGIANIAGEFSSAVVHGTVIRGWRYRQISAYSLSDVIMPLAVSATDVAKVTGVTIIADNAAYYPAQIADLTANKVVFDGNTVKYGTRGTANRAAFRFTCTSANTSIRGNDIEQINTFSTASNQVARSVWEITQVGDDPVYTGNDVILTAQGARGSFIKTTTTNQQWGYNGYWGVNEGNTLNGLPYASEIDGSYTTYWAAAGSGRFDGSDASNAFTLPNASNFDFILAQLPRCRGTLTIELADDINLGSGVPAALELVPCITSRKVVWSGVNTDSALATTKTAKLRTTGSWSFKFPEYSNNWVEFLEIKTGAPVVLHNPADVNACSVERTSLSAGTYAVLLERITGRVRFTSVGNAAYGIAAEGGARIVSIANDDNAAAVPTYGLYANGGAIMKNSTQPTGATANELAQNGGTIA